MPLPAWMVVGFAGSALLLGCQTLKNTPMQDYVWEMGRHCDSTTLHMSDVQADGQYTIRGASNVIDFAPYRDCMAAQFKQHPYQEWLKAHQ